MANYNLWAPRIRYRAAPNNATWPQNADRTAKRQREEKPVAECVVGGDPQTEI